MKEISSIYSKPPGQRYVIGDIHGCLNTFKSLIHEKINLTKNDWLFLVGDYIDRGPDSKGVIDYILSLKKNNYQVFPILGNHEKVILEYSTDFTYLQWHLKKHNALDMIDKKKGKLKSVYEIFLNSLPYCYDLGDFYIVHAGIDFSKSNPLKDYDSMLWLRNTQPDLSFLQGRKIIHGHQPTYLKQIKEKLLNRASVLPIDNGAVYRKPHKLYDYLQLGNLCGLNIDTFELFIQENID